MGPKIEPCDGHAAFLEYVGVESALSLLKRCPYCDVAPLTPGEIVERGHLWEAGNNGI